MPAQEIKISQTGAVRVIKVGRLTEAVGLTAVQDTVWTTRVVYIYLCMSVG